MSFLSVFKSIGKVFGKVNAVVIPLEPVIAAIPVYGGAFDTIFNAIVGIESLFVGTVGAAAAGGAGNGAAKKTAVTAIVNATVAAPASIPDTTLSTTIDQIVAALNQLQAAQAALSHPAPAA